MGKHKMTGKDNHILTSDYLKVFKEIASRIIHLVLVSGRDRGWRKGGASLYCRYCINQYNSPLYKPDRYWADVIIAKTSGAVTRDRENN